jgi:hypothetical protein
MINRVQTTLTPRSNAMNDLNTPPRHTWQELNRLHDEALERAQALRSEAMDVFWRGLGDALSAPRIAAQRAANRFVHRLMWHQRRRADGRSTAPASPR